MTRIAVVGHVEWVDFIPVERFPLRGDVVHASHAFSRAGGGAGVAASVLAGLGVAVEFFCALGRDRPGEATVEQLSGLGVRMHVSWRREPTRRAVTLLEPAGDRTIITVGERLQPLGSDELEWDSLRGADGAFFTAGDAAALTHAREAGALVASPRAREALIGSGPRVDALVFSGSDRDEAEWARRVESRARLLVETQGAEGGRWWGESRGRWETAALPGPPRDSYGCGDSFAAGLTAGLARGGTMAEAASLGARLGAEALARPGAP